MKMSNVAGVIALGGALLSAFPAFSYTVTIDGFEWTYSEYQEMGHTVIRIDKLGPRSVHCPLAIPSQIGSYEVRSIGERAFSGFYWTVFVTIPNSVTSIGARAFEDFTGMREVVIPNSVTNIGLRAFYGCRELTSVTIPDSVKSLDSSAFSGCRDLASVTIGNGVANIGNYAFKDCANLASVTIIGNGVANIGDYAFDNCANLASVTIGNGVANIGNYAFNNCANLASVTIGNGIVGIRTGAFFGCRGLKAVHISDLAAWCMISFAGKEANPLLHAHDLYLNGSQVKQLSIPQSATSIGSCAFCGFSGLTNVTIPNSVTGIGSSAFYGCSGLTSVAIPNSVTHIGSSAFEGCSGLTSVAIPNSVTHIGSSAFEGCSGLTSVAIGNGVTNIGASAFAGCKNLTSVNIPDSVVDLGWRSIKDVGDVMTVFSGCNKLWAKVFSTSGSGSTEVVTQQAAAPYDLTKNAADRAIATVTVNGDYAIGSFVLSDGKVYDSMLRIVNTANRDVKVTLPSGYAYETFKGATPLTIPAKSCNMLSITRTADKTFLVTREELETVR